MSMPEARHRSSRRRAVVGLRLALAAVLGLAAALLVSCGSSGKGLIPTANAGPLQADFEAVSAAARTGDGDCTATEAAIAKTEQDFNALPSSVDAGLRSTLSQGIRNLRERALELCTQPLATVTTGTATTSTTKTTPPATTPTTTATTTTTTPTTATTPTAPSTTPSTTTTPTPGGGTAAPGGEAPAAGGQGEERSGGVAPGSGGASGEAK